VRQATPLSNDSTAGAASSTSSGAQMVSRPRKLDLALVVEHGDSPVDRLQLTRRRLDLDEHQRHGVAGSQEDGRNLVRRP
jgi:hypothetical protein